MRLLLACLVAAGLASASCSDTSTELPPAASDRDAGMDAGSPDRTVVDAGPGAVDSDCDGLSDAFERNTLVPAGRATDPANPDSDGDGIPDGIERGVRAGVEGSGCPPVADVDPTTRTDPMSADSDGDGLPDGVEDLDHNGAVGLGESDPRRRDTDGDGLPDAVEDANRDGQRDADETDPSVPDSDGDGLADGVEDADLNGVVGPQETSPRRADSDGDGLVDGDEDTNLDGVRQRHESDPRYPDTDCDGLEDGRELTLGISPSQPDSDGDGLVDGVEAGAPARPAIEGCPAFFGDADPSTTTAPTNADTDGDGLPDGVEDRDQDGARSTGESDPALLDTDGDGVGDGIEVEIGSDPLDPSAPPSEIRAAVAQVCDAATLPPVAVHTEPGAWSLGLPPSVDYTPLTVEPPGSGVRGAALDDPARGLVGFVLEMPVIAGVPTGVSSQHQAVLARFQAAADASGWTVTSSAGPVARRYDGAEMITGARLDMQIASGQPVAAIRRVLLPWFTGLVGVAFRDVPNPPAAPTTRAVVRYQLVIRSAPDRLHLVVGVLAADAYDDPNLDAGTIVDGLAGGGALALPDARLERGCRLARVDPPPAADLLFVDAGAALPSVLVDSATQMVDLLRSLGVDVRFGVVNVTESRYTSPPGTAGTLETGGLVSDLSVLQDALRSAPSATFEFGLDAGFAAVARALPRTASTAESSTRLRGGVRTGLVYSAAEAAQEVTDVALQPNPFAYAPACATGIGDGFADPLSCAVVLSANQRACVDALVAPYAAQLRAERIRAGGLLLARSPTPQPCTAYACPGGASVVEPGSGYLEVLAQTEGPRLDGCGPPSQDALLEFVSQLLEGPAMRLEPGAVPGSVQVGLQQGSGPWSPVPPGRGQGFEQLGPVEGLRFHGAFAPPRFGDQIIAGYQRWTAPQLCPAGLTRDPVTGTCGCDPDDCAACSPDVCDATCACTCDRSRATRCRAGERWDASACSCVCDADCGGTCEPGQRCDLAQCVCR